jgi:hypothetical protein
MYADCQERLLPSQILVLDLRSGQHWMLTDFRAAAHAQFDPQDPSVVYFSSHNFRFVRSSYLALLQNASYDLKFEGPASVIKYALGPDGPRQLASFTAPDLFRLTNFHVFIHRHRKVLAGMSTPDFIYLFDAETTGIIAKLCVSHQAD